MTRKNEPCPFNIGQYVVYRPSPRGIALDAMAPTSQKLTPEKKYKITDIKNGLYIVVEDYKHPGGGLYWTEFHQVE